MLPLEITTDKEIFAYGPLISMARAMRCRYCMLLSLLSIYLHSHRRKIHHDCPFQMEMDLEIGSNGQPPMCNVQDLANDE